MILRLQAGPHDSERRKVKDDYELPERIYVIRCRQCGSHWYGEALEGAEVYRHDEERDGEHVYVFTDESLDGFLGVVETVTEPAQATVSGVAGRDADRRRRAVGPLIHDPLARDLSIALADCEWPIARLGVDERDQDPGHLLGTGFHPLPALIAVGSLDHEVHKGILA